LKVNKVVLSVFLVPMNSFDIGEDKKFVIVSCLNSILKLIDMTLGEVIAEYKCSHKSDQYHGSVKFSRDNSYIVQASEDNNIVLYDIVGKTEIIKLKGHVRPVITLDKHPAIDGRFISGSADGFIIIWSPID